MTEGAGLYSEEPVTLTRFNAVVTDMSARLRLHDHPAMDAYLAERFGRVDAELAAIRAELRDMRSMLARLEARG